MSIFPSQINQLYFEKEYTFVDQFGITVTCYGMDYGDHIESVTTGGKGKIHQGYLDRSDSSSTSEF